MVTVMFVRGPTHMSVDVVVIARDDYLVIVVMATAWGPLHVHVDMVIIARHHHRIVRAVIVVVRIGRGGATVKVDVLIITRYHDLAAMVVVADMDMIVSARDYNVAVAVPTCLEGSAASQPEVTELEERVRRIPPLVDGWRMFDAKSAPLRQTW